MKKCILSLIVGSIVALASCSQADEMPGQPQEGEQLATFTIQTPPATRTDVTASVSHFIVEAYEGTTAEGTPAARAEAYTNTLTVTLKKNTVYTFLFWAGKGTAKAGSTASSGYWNTDDLKAVTVTDSKKNDKGEAAYCLAKTFNSKDFEANKAVTLRNATAQVNFVEAAGLSAADNTLAVTYAAGATLNVGTGKVTEVSGEICHTFTGIGQVSADAPLATDYILAPKGEQRVIDLTLKLNDETPKTLTNVPFEQCFKTNIKGEYSSFGRFTFTITADDTWDGDHEYDLTVWDGKYPADATEAQAWLGTETSGAGDATARNHVFTITAPRQLAALHYLMVNKIAIPGVESINPDPYNPDNVYAYASYKLADDIDLGGKEWMAIGANDRQATYFHGIFDGQGHTIKNMYSSHFGYGGLFAAIETGGIVKHLAVKGTVTNSSGFRSGSFGGICSFLGRQGTIAWCSFEGSVSVINVAESDGYYIGGIAGDSDSAGNNTILGCYAVFRVSVTGEGQYSPYIGGITGKINDKTTAKGNIWLFGNNNVPANLYGHIPDGETLTGEGNYASTTAAGMNSSVDRINGYTTTDYDYQWQAGTTDSDYPVLVKKSAN